MSKFKPTLGLGTKLGAGITSNKADLNLYLSSLRKKQKEVRRKHSKNLHQDEDVVDDNDDVNTTEEDSDLASLAREFAKEEIQSSPFLKRKDEQAKRRSSSVTSMSATPLPEKDAPFVTSLVKKAPDIRQSGSAALESFMRFDKKYAAKNRNQEKENQSDTFDEEDILEDVKAPSPQKIASELENKVRRMSQEQKSGSFEPRSPEVERSPNRSSSKIQRKAAEDKKLRLTLPPPSTRVRKLSPDSIKTTSEVSDIPSFGDEDQGSSSPAFVIEELHGIEELSIAEDLEESKDKPQVESEPQVKDIETKGDVISEKETSSPSSESTLKPSVKEPVKSEADSKPVEEAKKSEDPAKKEKKSKSRRKDKVKKKSISSLTTCSETVSTSSSVPKRHRDKTRRSMRKKKKGEKCVYCAQLCSYHRSQVLNKSKKRHIPDKSDILQKTCANEKDVQAGPSRLQDVDHYLFDATLEPDFSQPINCSLNRIAQPLMNPWMTPSVESALSEMIKTQLELTESFLNGHKRLYAQYNEVIRRSVLSQRSQTKVLYPRHQRHVGPIVEDPEEEVDQDNGDYESDFEVVDDEEIEVVETEST